MRADYFCPSPVFLTTVNARGSHPIRFTVLANRFFFSPLRIYLRPVPVIFHLFRLGYVDSLAPIVNGLCLVHSYLERKSDACRRRNRRCLLGQEKELSQALRRGALQALLFFRSMAGFFRYLLYLFRACYSVVYLARSRKSKTLLSPLSPKSRLSALAILVFSPFNRSGGRTLRNAGRSADTQPG